MKDLDRIPPPYRERVQRLCRSAFVATGPHAAAAALAPFLAIADEADAAAGDGLRYGLDTATTTIDAQTARADVWARRMAEHGEHHAPPADAMRAEADEQRDPMAAAMMRMTASAWSKAGAAPEDDTVPPDLAADAVRAVRSAQRAHLEATRAQVPLALPLNVVHRLEGVGAPVEALVINDQRGAAIALDGLVRYLETHVSAMPVDLVQRAILALAMTLPAGPLAPTPEPVATLGVIVSLLRTLPIGRMPTVCLGGGAAGYKLLAARDGARTYTIAGTDETPPLRCVYVEYDGIEIKARCTRDEVP